MFTRMATLMVVLVVSVTAIVAPAEATPKHPWVKVKASSSKVTVGSTVTFSGNVGRHAPRQELRIQRRSGSQWVTVAKRKLPRASKTSSYRFRVKVQQVGRQKFRVKLAKKGKVRGPLHVRLS